MSPTPEQRRANVRLALILAMAAAIFAIGFVVRTAYFGG
jgi:hypothetical protein